MCARTLACAKVCARGSRAHLWHICAYGRLHCCSQCREHVVGHLTLQCTLCTAVTFSEGMAGVTSSCIKLVNAIIVSRAVPTTGSPQTE
jgi:hypothetical protein